MRRMDNRQLYPLLAVIEKKIEDSPFTGIPLRGEGSEAQCITFRDYMAMCLYDEDFGYYRSGPARVGKEGDFYTSGAVGGVMASVLARYLSARHDGGMGTACLLEWGAGTGRLSAGIRAEGLRLDREWDAKYWTAMAEDHPAHAAAALESFARGGLTGRPEVWSSDEAWKRLSRGMGGPVAVLANELLDAFPVHRVVCLGGKLREIGVGSGREGLYETAMPLTDAAVAESLRRDGIRLAEGQTTEVNLEAERWIGRLSAVPGSLAVILLDYGHKADEYAAEHRMEGTLLTYRNHTAGFRPLDCPGAQDLTAHVNFTSIRRAAREAGFRIDYDGTQLQFLLDYGALELLSDHRETDPFGPASRRNRAVRQLLLSDGMSETFKVMALSKAEG